MTAFGIKTAPNMKEKVSKQPVTKLTCNTPTTRSQQGQPDHEKHVSPRAVKVLVIATIDGKTLTQVLGTAKETGITVIAYDRFDHGHRRRQLHLHV
jgi:ABC-type xylose transport system substrate-binding protein